MSYNPPNDMGQLVPKPRPIFNNMDSSHDIEEAVLAELSSPPCFQGVYDTKTGKCGTIPPPKKINTSDSNYVRIFILCAVIALVMVAISGYRIYTNTGVPTTNQIEKK